MRNAYIILAGKPEWRIYFKGIGLDERIILKRILKKWKGLDSPGFE
jgi:hypothetical protein